MVRLVMPLAALSLLGGSGCTDRNSPPPNSSGPAATSSGVSVGPDAGETVVRVEDDGKTFDVVAGTSVVFKLAASGGTGYVWMPTLVDPNVLAQQGDRASDGTSDVPGAPKNDVYRFTAFHPGSTTIQMDLQRPWTKTAPPAKSIHVVVNVR